MTRTIQGLVLLVGVVVLAGIGAAPALGADIVINELMYNPPYNDQYEMNDIYFEWIELYNPNPADVDLSNYRVTTNLGFDYEIPRGTIISAGGYVIVANDLRAFTGRLPFGWQVACPVVGLIYSDSTIISNSGDTVSIYNANGEMIDRVSYSDREGWPLGADGTGFTLELRDPTLDNALPTSWAASLPTAILGTPGRPNSVLEARGIWLATGSISPSVAVAQSRIGSVAVRVRNNDVATMQELKLILNTAWPWSGKSADVIVTGSSGATVKVVGSGEWGSPYRVIVSGLAVMSGAEITMEITHLVASSMEGDNRPFSLEASNGSEWRPLAWTPEITITDTLRLANHVVLNEVYYNGGDTTHSNYYDWVELYNPGDTPVCLDGWFIMDGLPEVILNAQWPRGGAIQIPNLTERQDFIISGKGFFLIAFDENFYRNEFPTNPAPNVEGNLDFASRSVTGQRLYDPALNGPAPNGWRIGNIGLNKTRDEVILYDGRQIVDAVAWGNGRSFNMLTSEWLISNYGRSLARKTDGVEAQETRGPLSELVGNSFTPNAAPTPGAANR